MEFSVMLPRSAVVLLSLCLAVFCCQAASAAAPLPVVVSIAPQKYMLERIAGDAVSVTVLVKPGSDPHAYEPTPGQMRAAGEAAAWFTIGVPFEEVWLPRITGAAQQMRVISSLKGITRLSFADEGRILADLELTLDAQGREPHDGKEEDDHDGHVHDHSGHGHSHGGPKGEDPHVWLSPMLVRRMLPGLAKELGALMPERAAAFRAGAASFAEELERLDAELAVRFSEFPRGQRVFLTFHPSWRYFAHNYQLTELSIEIDGKEPGPKSLKAVTDTARRLGIRTVFVEPQFPKASAEAVASAIGATVVVADPLAEDLPALFSHMAEKLIESFKRQPPQ